MGHETSAKSWLNRNSNSPVYIWSKLFTAKQHDTLFSYASLIDKVFLTNTSLFSFVDQINYACRATETADAMRMKVLRQFMVIKTRLT